DLTSSYATTTHGTLCDDANACTKKDVGTGGTRGGTPFPCAAPDQCHQAGTCNGDGTCSYATKSDGTTCDDGNACTKNDVCTAGTGRETVVSGARADQGHDGGIWNGEGTCSCADKPDGTTCGHG